MKPDIRTVPPKISDETPFFCYTFHHRTRAHSSCRRLQKCPAARVPNESYYCTLSLVLFIAPPAQGTSRKKIMRVERQERAAEEEANFIAQVFHTGMDDWEEVDIFNE